MPLPPPATDRSLLLLEPFVFRDHAWLGQTLVSGEVNSVGTTIEFTDIDLAAAGITAGSVVTVGGASFEIVEITGTSEATFSVLRATPDDPPIPPPKFVDAPAYIMTFRPQIDLAHRAALRLAGFDPDITIPDEPDPSMIMNLGTLARLEALGALHLIYTAASSINAELAPHAAFYRHRFDEERRRVVLHLDTDNDGIADTARRLYLAQLTRA